MKKSWQKRTNMNKSTGKNMIFRFPTGFGGGERMKKMNMSFIQWLRDGRF